MVSSRDRVFRTEGIVIRRVDFGEADRVLTVCTPGLGKLRVIAKGVRRTTSRLGGHVELFTRANMLVARGRNLGVVTQSQTVDSFRALREDLTRIGYAYYVAELLDQFTVDEEESYPLYRLLQETLSRLSSADDCQLPIRSFEVQLLQHSGFGPELRRCLVCRSDLLPTVNYFSHTLGGTICRNCVRSDPGARELSLNALKLLRLLQSGDYGQASRVRIPGILAAELESILGSYLSHVSQKRLKSMDFIHTIEREAESKR